MNNDNTGQQTNQKIEMVSRHQTSFLAQIQHPQISYHFCCTDMPHF